MGSVKEEDLVLLLGGSCLPVLQKGQEFSKHHQRNFGRSVLSCISGTLVLEPWNSLQSARSVELREHLPEFSEGPSGGTAAQYALPVSICPLDHPTLLIQSMQIALWCISPQSSASQSTTCKAVQQTWTMLMLHHAVIILHTWVLMQNVPVSRKICRPLLH